MTKPNKDGWIRHRGGKCPVPKGTLIDVRHRDSCIYEGVDALGTNNWVWDHSNGDGDIMAYRIHTPKPQETQAVTAESLRAEYLANIEAIQAAETRKADCDKEIAERLQENEVLTEKVRALGFDFYTPAPQPEEDMSDPKNWRVGDRLTLVDPWCEDVRKFKDKLVTVRGVEKREGGVLAFGIKEDRDASGMACRFKFHSRPK